MLRPVAGVARVKTVDAVQVLVRYGTKPLIAKRAVEALIAKGDTTVTVPNASSKIAADLATAGVAANPIEKLTLDVRAVRERLHLSQEDFARRYNFKLRSVQNWEQGRKPEDAVQSYLRVIARFPKQAAEAQESDWSNGNGTEDDTIRRR